jgi:transitional endoplasmic reticulum ATPase
MDGVIALEDVVIVAATNRPDIIDRAVLRPGRFDRLIYVPEPGEVARVEIFKIYTKEMPLKEDVSIEQLAKTLKGYSGADIQALCREAALNALRRNIESDIVEAADFKAATDKVGPTVTPDMETWYKNFLRQARKFQKPATPVA